MTTHTPTKSVHVPGRYVLTGICCAVIVGPVVAAVVHLLGVR